MKEIIINGGVPLVGEVKVSGSKNAALPILFATLVAKGVSRLDKVPDIGDVRVTLDILKCFGAEINRTGDSLYVNTENLHYAEPPEELISRIRASTYLIGAGLARFGRCKLGRSGGCNFSARPIDMHLYAAAALGASVKEDYITADVLHPSEINFNKPSVGATSNALILASAIKGVTKIRGFAREPHVIALSDFLVSAGAKISFCENEITVIGGELHGGELSIIGDMIEAGTYLAAGLITGGKVSVSDVPVRDMTTFVDFMREIGANVRFDSSSVTAYMSDAPRRANIMAEPYPGFPTDLQPIAAALLAKLSGGEIVDIVWRERFGYLNSLARFGTGFKRKPYGAVVEPSAITPAAVSAPDLRGGAACLLLGLSASGQSRIRSAETILRGYENLDKKLRAIGADIKINDINKM